MTKSDKLAVIVTASWSIISVCTAGINAADVYEGWFFFFLGLLALWMIPVGAYWAYRWTCGPIQIEGSNELVVKTKEVSQFIVRALSILYLNFFHVLVGLLLTKIVVDLELDKTLIGLIMGVDLKSGFTSIKDYAVYSRASLALILTMLIAGSILSSKASKLIKNVPLRHVVVFVYFIIILIITVIISEAR